MKVSNVEILKRWTANLSMQYNGKYMISVIIKVERTNISLNLLIKNIYFIIKLKNIFLNNF